MQREDPLSSCWGIRRFHDVRLPDSLCWFASWARRTPWCCRVVASRITRKSSQTVTERKLSDRLHMWIRRERDSRKKKGKRERMLGKIGWKFRIYGDGCWPLAKANGMIFNVIDRPYAVFSSMMTRRWCNYHPVVVTWAASRAARAGTGRRRWRWLSCVSRGDLIRVKLYVTMCRRPDLLTGSNESK